MVCVYSIFRKIILFSDNIKDNDDVVTSPYNSLLALNELVNHADCVIPIDN